MAYIVSIGFSLTVTWALVLMRKSTKMELVETFQWFRIRGFFLSLSFLSSSNNHLYKKCTERLNEKMKSEKGSRLKRAQPIGVSDIE